MKYFKWIVTAVLTFLSIREMEHIFNKLLNEDSYLKINELVFDKLLSPSITFCQAPGWKSPGPFKNSGEFSNNTYSWEEIFHPQSLKVLKNESLYNITQTYASYYGLCFTMQKLTPERVSDHSFQIVVNNTVDYIYYLHELCENEYLFMSVYPHEGKYHNKKK